MKCNEKSTINEYRDPEKNSEPSTSGTSKQSLITNQDNEIIKKQKIVNNAIEKHRTENEKAYKPIASLTPMQFCPPIKGILISVSEWGTTSIGMRYSNFVLKDSSGEINGIIYRLRCSDFENKFQIGATLLVEMACIKQVRPNYFEKSKSKYELCIPNTLRTITIESSKDCEIREETNNFVARILIRELVEKIEPQKLVNVIGVVINVEDIKNVNYNGKNMITRDIRIVDESSMDIAVTIWNEKATKFNSPVGSVVGMYQVAVRIPGERKVKNLTFQKNSHLEINPPIVVTERLKNWYNEWKSDNEWSLRKYAVNPSTGNPNIDRCANEKSEQTINVLRSEDETYEKRPPNVSIVESDVPQLNPLNSVIPVKSNFTKIDVIREQIAPGKIINILGVIKRRTKLQTIQCLNGETFKLSIELTDESRQSIWMAIWGKKAKMIDERKNLIVAAKRVQVRCWKNEKEINCTDKISSIIVEPKIHEAQALREWYKSNVLNVVRTTTISTAPLTSIDSLKDGQESSILGILMKINEAKVIEASYFMDVARTIEIIDDSQKMILVTLWSETAQNFNIPEESVIFIANLKIFVANDIKGAFTPTSYLKIDPPEYEENIIRLKRWFACYKCNRSINLEEELQIPEDYSWSDIDNFDN